jgi:topoisomerase-4 subunit A
MESLFKLTELESKIPLNLNVLVKGRIPKVLGLAECLREWLDHLRDVLLRRSNFRKNQIEHRLEVLGGYLIAYLNIDEVIRIIRTEDEPKPALMKAFSLTELQAESILNMRLRSLRKLEEFEIRKEDKELRAELKGINAILKSETEQWAKVGEQVRKVRDIFGPKTPLGKRRTVFADAPEHDLAALEESLVEREPVTVVISEKGWVRTLKGQVADLSNLTFKTDDKLDKAFFAETTSKLMLLATNGRFYSLDVSKLPGGRGHGEPIRLFIDMEGDAAIVSMFVHKGGRKFLIASHDGQGFLVNEDDCVGTTRKGKQVLNVEMPNEARALTVVGEGSDQVAVIGTNHKMVIFPLDQVPEMARGRGVRLQKYTSAGLSDVATFVAKEGLTWKDSSDREHRLTWKELADWRGNRADAGRLAAGLPKSNKFGRVIE